MKLRIAVLIAVLACPDAFAGFCGWLNYKCQHKRNFKNKLRRNGLAIELRGEEPKEHKQEVFPPTMSWWANQRLMERVPRRILLMPLTNPWDNSQVSQKTTRIFLRELLKAGFSDVLSLNDMRPENDGVKWPWSKWPDPMRVGQVRYPELVEAAERFQADAVLYGQITIHKRTEPQNFGLKALMVAACEDKPQCEVLWAIDVVLDEADLEIWDRAKQYYVQRTYKHWARDDVTQMEPYGGTRFYGHRLMLASTDRYLEYCFYEVTKNLRIAARGLRWPHYRYEKEASPKSVPGDVMRLEYAYAQAEKEDEKTSRSTRRKRRSDSCWPWCGSSRRKTRSSAGKAPSRTRGYPPYLYRRPPTVLEVEPETPKEPLSSSSPRAQKVKDCDDCP